MSFVAEYTSGAPSVRDVESMAGPCFSNLGIPGAVIAVARIRSRKKLYLTNHQHVRHIRVADASGRPLGRWFGVKLWPTLVFLKDGKEMSRLVRPTTLAAINRALDQIEAP